jgi:catechol 2,3-dioxygenase-like lactoylglutathione lyase family enzyme
MMDKIVTEPLLELNFLSHGTLLMEDLDASRLFFENFLGLEMVKTSEVSIAIRLDSDTCVVGVERGKIGRKSRRKSRRKSGREYLHHDNVGLSVGDAVEVARARELAIEHKDTYSIRTIGDTVEESDGLSFHIEDRDGNFWHIMNDQPAH